MYMLIKKLSILLRNLISRRLFPVARTILQHVEAFLLCRCNDLRYLLSGEKHKIKHLKNRYSGRRCFIIATGPSLNKTNLASLSPEFTFAVKSFLFSGIDRFRLVPSFYCWSDRGTLESNIARFPHANPSGMMSFFPFSMRRFIYENLKWSRDRMYFIDDVYEWRVHSGTFSVDADRKLYCSGSVVIDYCIPLAIYMGFNPIYLIGCDQEDHNSARHFDGNKIPLSGVSTPWHIINQSFETVKKYADANNIKIFTATKGGCLEVFERVDLEQALR